MTKQQKRDLIARYLDAYNSFDVDGMMATVHPEVEFENVAAGEVTARASGAAELRQMAELAASAFSSRRQTMTSFDADDKGASIQVSYTAKLAVDLPNGMKAGETLALEGQSDFQFRDGMISRIVDRS